VLGSRIIQYKGHEIDLNPPWKRIDLRQALIDAVGIDIASHPDGPSLEVAMSAKGLKFKPESARGKLIDGLLGDFLEPNLIQPTFLVDYRAISRRWPRANRRSADGGAL